MVKLLNFRLLAHQSLIPEMQHCSSSDQMSSQMHFEMLGITVCTKSAWLMEDHNLLVHVAQRRLMHFLVLITSFSSVTPLSVIFSCHNKSSPNQIDCSQHFDCLVDILVLMFSIFKSQSHVHRISITFSASLLVPGKQSRDTYFQFHFRVSAIFIGPRTKQSTTLWSA